MLAVLAERSDRETSISNGHGERSDEMGPDARRRGARDWGV